MGRSGGKAKNTQQPSLDFKVKKKKLGKKAPPNPNLTVTTFKSKALNMPGQSIAEEKDDLVNHRNLTLKDLLTKLNHYSDQVKKDTVIGIRDLILKHPSVLYSHLGAIMNKLVEIINDLDKDVRHCTHTLITSILPMLDEISISPFIPLFSVYINSGMTHLKTTIRLDSLRLLDIFIDHYPRLVSRHCHQMIPNYIDLLKRVSGSATMATISSSTSSSASVPSASSTGDDGEDLTAGTLPKQGTGGSKKSNATKSLPKANSLHTRIMILKSLFKLVKVLVSEPDLSYSSMLDQIHKQQTNTGVVDSKMLVDCSDSFSVYNDKKIFNSLFNKYTIKNEAATGTSSLIPTILETPEELRMFSATLLPILIDCWLELGPSNPGISFQVLEDLELVVNVIHLLVHCLKENFSTTPFYEQFRKDYVKFFSGHFPFYVGSSNNPDSKEWVISVSINSTMTQTATHFLGYSPLVKGSTQDDAINNEGSWYQPFLEFIQDSFAGKLIDERVEGQKGQTVKNTVSNLLWIVKIILPILNSQASTTLLNAFISFDEKCHPHSTSKKACVFFIKELIEIQSNPLLAKDKSFKNIIEWGLTSLPKLLWKLGNSDNDTSLMILNILLSVGKDKSKLQQYDSIQNAMVPFYFTISKPTPQFPNGKQIYGPFSTLPLNIQFLSLSTLYYFSSLNKIMIRSLIAICRSKKTSLEIISIVLDLIHNLYQVGKLKIDHYIAFCIAITLSITSSDDNEVRVISVAGSSLGSSSLSGNQDKIIKKLCWNINSLRLSNSINDVLDPMTPPFISELEKIISSYEQNENSGEYTIYILSLIYSCFYGDTTKDYKLISSDLVPIITKSIFTYIFQSIKLLNNNNTSAVTPTTTSTSTTSSTMIDLDLNIILLLIKCDESNLILLNILKLVELKLNFGKSQVEKNNNNQYAILAIIELFKCKELYEIFQITSIKSNVVQLVKKVEKLITDKAEKYLVEKLLSESKLLFNE